MEVLFWLLPAAVVTTLAMVAVGWWGREGRGEVDRETAARRLGEALGRERGTRPGYAVPPRQLDRSTGIAVRAPYPGAAPATRPVALPPAVVADPEVESVRVVEAPAGDTAGATGDGARSSSTRGGADDPRQDRRAS